ncbi:Origin recognition complex protein 5 [Hibiscus syriacus]|uniref:Origin recognition complex protein 5 n=1 Tax=Hibiscus syriacus TaxID=106335 RepID=A0A6A3A336_HIBSY|nr:Origin recognition complex protein 5 [Hibiscus syriacus]
MADNGEEKENIPRGNEWEVVSLTASAYAAAPGPKEVETKDDSIGPELYSAATFSSFHSEEALGGSTTAVSELIEASEQDFGFPSDMPESAKPLQDDKSDGSDLPCEAWWKRRAISFVGNKIGGKHCNISGSSASTMRRLVGCLVPYIASKKSSPVATAEVLLGGSPSLVKV